jgi:hypothetical protein
MVVQPSLYIQTKRIALIRQSPVGDRGAGGGHEEQKSERRGRGGARRERGEETPLRDGEEQDEEKMQFTVMRVHASTVMRVCEYSVQG